MTTRVLRLAALAAGVTVSALMVAPTTAGADPAPVVWKSPVDPAVYTVDHTLNGDLCHALSFAEWQALGAPTPQLFPTEYLAVPGFPYVYSSVTMCGRVQEDVLSFDQWRSVGSPTPRQTWQIQEIQYFRYLSSPAEIFAEPEGRTIVPYAVHMTPATWSAAGSPTPFTQQFTYVRPSWTAHVFVESTYPGSSGYPVPIDLADWVQEGAPTPDVVSGLPGGVFTQSHDGPEIWYTDGRGVSFHVTYAEWAAAGYPRPVQR